MKLITLDNYQESIIKTAEVIKNGGLVLFPSDTVYILAVDATNPEAVKKLLGFKNRWTGKAISVAVTDKKMAQEYVELDENALDLYDRLLPGPFTIVSNSKHKTATGIEAENGTLGIRIPDNQAIMDLVKEVGKPVSATSANLSGRAPHYSVESLLKTLSQKKAAMLDLIVDGGKLPKNKPSTVIDITESEIKILRRGDLITGKTATLVSKSEKETEKIARFIFNKITNNQTKPIVFGLTGDLGCGKTVFSRSIGRYLGVTEKITSPTFFIYNEYEIKSLGAAHHPLPSGDLQTSDNKGTTIHKFLHFDLYRISGAYELEEIKFLDLFEEKTISCIEWPENMGAENLEKLKQISDFHMISFGYVDETTREIKY